MPTVPVEQAYDHISQELRDEIEHDGKVLYEKV